MDMFTQKFVDCVSFGNRDIVIADAQVVDELSECEKIITFGSSKKLTKILRRDYFCSQVIELAYEYRTSDLVECVKKEIGGNFAASLIKSKLSFDSCITACITARIDFESCTLHDVVPKKILDDYFKIRAEAIAKLSVGKLVKREMNKTLFCLSEMEENGIFVDTNAFILSTQVEKSFIGGLRSTVNEDSRLVYVNYALERAVTGRLRTTGGWNCMNIPAGNSRKCVKSRFKDGKIVSFDYNAADYRSLLYSTKDKKLISLYASCDDFHTRTVELIFGNSNKLDIRRPAAKSVVYAWLYGSSTKALAKDMGMSEDIMRKLLEKMDFMEPLREFRNEVYRQSTSDGFITLPDGNTINLKGTEHFGKVLAWYCQYCSNEVFLSGFRAAHDIIFKTQSKDMFTVHDELVVDFHPDDLPLIPDIVKAMENGSSVFFNAKFVVKAKIGNNYCDMERIQ